MSASERGIVSVHAISAGIFTLPERFFVSPLSDADARKTVPSLAFLIQHQSPVKNQVTRLMFDLGIRRDVSQYSPEICSHLKTRQPMTTVPCVVESLAAGGLSPDDIDYVVLSHVHWDHVGTPSEFRRSTFVVGYGSLALLDGSLKLVNGSHSHFEEGLLPKERTIELLNPERTAMPKSDDETSNPGGDNVASRNRLLEFRPWRSFSIFPAAIDVFEDGSLYILDAPGHLPGHINLLCRTSNNPERYVLLGGDSCHDRRLVTGEKHIAEWSDPARPGVTQCIHADKEMARETLRRIRDAELGIVDALGSVEVVFAHDSVWEADAKENGRFWPGHL